PCAHFWKPRPALLDELGRDVESARQEPSIKQEAVLASRPSARDKNRRASRVDQKPRDRFLLDPGAHPSALRPSFRPVIRVDQIACAILPIGLWVVGRGDRRNPSGNAAEEREAESATHALQLSMSSVRRPRGKQSDTTAFPLLSAHVWTHES